VNPVAGVFRVVAEEGDYVRTNGGVAPVYRAAERTVIGFEAWRGTVLGGIAKHGNEIFIVAIESEELLASLG
jgi:hypothetical protein